MEKFLDVLFKRIHLFYVILGFVLISISFYLWLLIGKAALGKNFEDWIKEEIFQAFLFVIIFAIVGSYLIDKGLTTWSVIENITRKRDIENFEIDVIKKEAEFVNLQMKIIEHNRLVGEMKKLDKEVPYKEIPPADLEKLLSRQEQQKEL